MQESIQLVIDSLPFLLKGLGIPCNSVSAACFWLTTRVYSRADAPVANLARALAGAFYISIFVVRRSSHNCL